jgi:hypothetical protein
LNDVLAHEHTGLGVEDTDEYTIPLHLDRVPNPAWRCTVISGVDFNAAIGMHLALAELVITERLQRQRQQGGFLFAKHDRHLPLRGAVDPGIGPAGFPLIQISLGFFQTFEALALERCFLGVADS